ncbi:class 3 adenylate cyclase [Roseiarcus fermentans]|uniref:Class 3 adenylate cyclase n=1 Tax=Roseiarcus fermentans TaxID=1473586 RepID=A0A366F142_9HYPH|nr:adenylate/guanylate cyclase domain-containing protein [Roseiarcus fermentans]RBP07435.1 class 3 adenylate cyclase [Roseiarcus fermentans]
MRLSLRSKIILTLLPLGLVCLAIGGALGYRTGYTALTASIEQQLTAQREAKRQRVESYVRNQLRLTDAAGGFPVVAEASAAFLAALKAVRAAPADPAAQGAADTALEAWYQKNFVPRIDRIAGGHAEAAKLVPQDPTSRRLQADYIARNPNDPGRKDGLVAAPGGDAYDQVHARFHPILKHFVDSVGFYDINLVDPETGDVFYTVEKEVDFLSNVKTNPFGRSGFAQIVERALDPRNGGKAVVQDLTPYPPSGFGPQFFTAVPIVVDGRTIAVMVAQLDIEAMNRLLTDGGRWRESGQGETGEVYLVGEDRLMRSQSRFAQEHPEALSADLKSAGLPEATIKGIEAFKSTILYLPVKTDGVEKAFHNQIGVARYNDYRGKAVIGAYGPIEVAGLRWAIVAEQDSDEALAPVTTLRRDLLAAAALAAVALTLFALGCASVFTRPIRGILAAMVSFRDKRELRRVPVTSSDEFGDLETGYNAMADEIDARDQAIRVLNREKEQMVRSMYPATVAERLQRGVETTAETVSNVTVAVCLFDGIETPDAPISADEARERLNALFDVLLATATACGIEPVHALGGSYVAVCGLSSPRFDHADRTLAWIRESARGVSRLGADWVRDVSLRFGVASGDLDVLVFSAGHAPYDVWGRTLGVARRLAAAAAPQTAWVDESAFALLGGVDGLQPCPPVENGPSGRIASWSLPLSQAVAEAAQ